MVETRNQRKKNGTELENPEGIGGNNNQRNSNRNQPSVVVSNVLIVIITMIDEAKVPTEKMVLTCDCHNNRKNCSDNTCSNRVMRSECPRDCKATNCQNQSLSRKLFANTKVVESKGRKMLRIEDGIPEGKLIVELVGDVLSKVEAFARKQEYEKEKKEYQFHRAGNCYIDTTNCGNESRFMRISCTPNTVRRAILVPGTPGDVPRVGYYANEPIAAIEDVTTSCKFMMKGSAVSDCACGRSDCQQKEIGKEKTGKKSAAIITDLEVINSNGKASGILTQLAGLEGHELTEMIGRHLAKLELYSNGNVTEVIALATRMNNLEQRTGLIKDIFINEEDKELKEKYANEGMGVVFGEWLKNKDTSIQNINFVCTLLEALQDRAFYHSLKKVQGLKESIGRWKDVVSPKGDSPDVFKIPKKAPKHDKKEGVTKTAAEALKSNTPTKAADRNSHPKRAHGDCRKTDNESARRSNEASRNENSRSHRDNYTRRDERMRSRSRSRSRSPATSSKERHGRRYGETSSASSSYPRRSSHPNPNHENRGGRSEGTSHKYNSYQPRSLFEFSDHPQVGLRQPKDLQLYSLDNSHHQSLPPMFSPVPPPPPISLETFNGGSSAIKPPAPKRVATLFEGQSKASHTLGSSIAHAIPSEVSVCDIPLPPPPMIPNMNPRVVAKVQDLASRIPLPPPMNPQFITPKGVPTTPLGVFKTPKSPGGPLMKQTPSAKRKHHDALDGALWSQNGQHVGNGKSSLKDIVHQMFSPDSPMVQLLLTQMAAAKPNEIRSVGGVQKTTRATESEFQKILDEKIQKQTPTSSNPAKTPASGRTPFSLAYGTPYSTQTSGPFKTPISSTLGSQKIAKECARLAQEVLETMTIPDSTTPKMSWLTRLLAKHAHEKMLKGKPIITKDDEKDISNFIRRYVGRKIRENKLWEHYREVPGK